MKHLRVKRLKKSHVTNLVLDVDGVITNGKFVYTQEGKISKEFGSHDSDALQIVKEKINVFFISADKKGFDISKKRINDMGFGLELISADSREKYILEKKNTGFTVYIGDSFTDIPAMLAADFSMAPRNAFKPAKRMASFVLSCNGGEGAVAEACVHICPSLFDLDSR
jgi:3-deoxy-D-manno-octulosonate 8-phosphate phosphatase (KDO 8-P phosphatase)